MVIAMLFFLHGIATFCSHRNLLVRSWDSRFSNPGVGTSSKTNVIFGHAGPFPFGMASDGRKGSPWPNITIPHHANWDRRRKEKTEDDRTKCFKKIVFHKGPNVLGKKSLLCMLRIVSGCH